MNSLADKPSGGLNSARRVIPALGGTGLASLGIIHPSEPTSIIIERLAPVTPEIKNASFSCTSLVETFFPLICRAARWMMFPRLLVVVPQKCLNVKSPAATCLGAAMPKLPRSTKSFFPVCACGIQRTAIANSQMSVNIELRPIFRGRSKPCAQVMRSIEFPNVARSCY